MNITIISYETLVACIDWEDGTHSFSYREDGYCGSVQMREDKLLIGIITEARCYVVELDITPDHSKEIASYWAMEVVKNFKKVKKSRKAMKTLITANWPNTGIAFYSTDNRTHRNLKEYYRNDR